MLQSSVLGIGKRHLIRLRMQLTQAREGLKYK